MLAGVRSWSELGRFVKKGEKEIMILAPIVRRRTDDQAKACRFAGTKWTSRNN